MSAYLRNQSIRVTSPCRLSLSWGSPNDRTRIEEQGRTGSANHSYATLAPNRKVTLAAEENVLTKVLSQH
jgi:hypothetical protein